MCDFVNEATAMPIVTVHMHFVVWQLNTFFTLSENS